MVNKIKCVLLSFLPLNSYFACIHQRSQLQFPGHRFKTTYDFGFVALDILYAYAEDSGTYMCKAKNAVGEAVTSCSVSVICEYIVA